MAAAFKARLMTVNLNYRYTAGEFEYILRDCGAKALFYQAEFGEVVARLRERGLSIEHWLRMGEDEADAAPRDAIAFEALATTGDGRALEIERSDDDGYLLYTGGTTGMPKGVHWTMRSGRSVSLESPLMKRVPRTLADHLEMVGDGTMPGRTLAACPLMHGTAFNAAMTELMNGGTAVMLPGRRFDAVKLWQEVERSRITRLAIVGDVFAKPMLAALDAAPGAFDLSSLRVISSSGLSWSRRVRQGLLRHLPHVILNDILAASEAAGFGWALSTKDNIPPDGYFPAGPDAVLIDPETGKLLPRRDGVVGFLARKGTMAEGYYGDPAKTASTYREIDGVRYVVPGDLARWVAPDGLIMIGRENLSINTGGEKVFPEEVEEALKSLPHVTDALVVGLPDPQWGKTVIALVQPDGEFDEAQAEAGLHALLARYKHPKRYFMVDAVPRHVSGKADYRKAAALVESHMAERREAAARVLVKEDRSMSNDTARRQGYSAAHWGIYEVDSVRDSNWPRLRPLSLDPDPTRIGLDQLDPETQALRVKRPAIRKSWLEKGAGANPELRGREPFVEVDWETALAAAAAELQRVKTEHGNQSIFGGSYGWASAGRFHHAQSQIHRFLNCHGGYVRHVDSYSLGAGRCLLDFISTSIDTHLYSHTSWDVMADHTQLFLTFGGVPLKNAQVSGGGSGRHRVREGLQAMQRAGTRFVNVSPVSDNLETGGDVEWVPIRPNTDTAMMLALAYEISRDDAFDRSFVDSHAIGYDRFRAYVWGETDGTPKTPEWAEAITGVPAATMRALAHEMLRKRTMVNVAWALQRAAHGEQPFWMVITLAAMIGQIGLPGGGYGLGYGAINVVGSAHRMLPGPTFSQGRNPVDHFIPVARIADMLLNPGAPFTYQGKTHEYQDIRLIYWAGGNPFHHHQDLNRLRKAWQRPETVIVNEQYWAPIARHADIVFPATISLERNDIGFSKGEGFVVAMEKAVDPIGEARDDYEIFAGLAERLGFADRFTEGLSADQWVRRIYDDNLAHMKSAGVELPDFEAFWEKGLIDLAAFDRPVIMHEKFRADPEANPLGTPTGKLEIFSETIASFGLEDCPGHPVWMEPFEWLGSEAASEYPLHMISDQPVRKLHSQLDHSGFSREAKVAGREPVLINPADAASRGINNGDLVELFNGRGRCLAGAKVSPAVMPGVVRLSTGSWFDSKGGVDRNANPNTLTLDRGSSSFSQGCSAQTCLVDIRKVENGNAPESKAYELPALQ